MPQQTQDTFLITLTPQQLAGLQGWRAVPAILAYRLGPGPHLFRSDSRQLQLPKGALMVVNDIGFDGLGQTAPLAREILLECKSRGFSGIILDFERCLPSLGDLVQNLDQACLDRNLALYIPEEYSSAATYARIMIPSALSGGSLQVRLDEAAEQFGVNRVALALELVAEDFFLPAPTGSGVPLSREQLSALMDQLSPSVFFSRELCARYFTYMSRESGAHFVLFDDADTLQQKIETAHQSGIHTFLAPLAQVAPHLPRLGLSRSIPLSHAHSTPSRTPIRPK